MKKEVKDILPGSILAKDISLKSGNVLMYAETKLYKEQIDILKSFLIKSVEIFIDDKEIVTLNEENIDGFEQLEQEYLNCVAKFKIQFVNIQSGTAIDILKFREIIVPLFELLKKQPDKILFLMNLHTKQDYIYHHCVCTGLISGLIAHERKLDDSESLQIVLGGLLSDTGMTKLPLSIMSKSGALNASEVQYLKQHPTYSYKLVENIPTIKKEVKIAMLQHHERLDGSGYPLNTKTDRIHDYAKIIAIADVFHAMTSNRHYKNKMHYIEVIEYMLYESFGKFDNQFIYSLCKIILNLKQDDEVILNTGEEAIVKFITSEQPTRPYVFIKERELLVDMSKNKELKIRQVIKR